MQAAFKPGTSTWDTDDPDQQPWLKHRKKKGRGGEEEKPDVLGAAPEPLPFQSSAKLVQRQMTTGAHPASQELSSLSPERALQKHECRIARNIGVEKA